MNKEDAHWWFYVMSYPRLRRRELGPNKTQAVDRKELVAMYVEQDGKCWACEVPFLRSIRPEMHHGRQPVKVAKIQALLCRRCNMAESFLMNSEVAYRIANLMEVAEIEGH